MIKVKELRDKLADYPDDAYVAVTIDGNDYPLENVYPSIWGSMRISRFGGGTDELDAKAGLITFDVNTSQSNQLVCSEPENGPKNPKK